MPFVRCTVENYRNPGYHRRFCAPGNPAGLFPFVNATQYGPVEVAYVYALAPFDNVSLFGPSAHEKEVAGTPFDNSSTYGAVTVGLDQTIGPLSPYGNVHAYGPVDVGADETLDLTSFNNSHAYGPVDVALEVTPPLSPFVNAHDYGEYIATLAYGNTASTGHPLVRQVDLLSGRTRWSYTVPTVENGSYGLETDRSGRSLVWENVAGSGILRALNKHGALEWTYDVTSNGAFGTAGNAASDRDRNVYVVATGSGGFGDNEYGSLIKLDSSGAFLWKVEPFSGENQNGAYHFCRYVAVDDDGNAYVCSRARIAKYDPDGNELWNVAVSLSLGADDIFAICVDANGSVYAALDDDDVTGGALWKGAQSNGGQTWRIFPPNAQRQTAVTASRDGSRVVVGGSPATGGTDDVEVYGYDSTGSLDWTHTGEPWVCMDLKIDDLGRVVATWATASPGADWHLLQDNGASVSVLNSSTDLESVNVRGVGWAYAGGNVTAAAGLPVSVSLTPYDNTSVYGAVALETTVGPLATFANSSAYGAVTVEIPLPISVAPLPLGAALTQTFGTGSGPSVTMPSTRADGDMLLVLCGNEGGGNIYQPTASTAPVLDSSTPTTTSTSGTSHVVNIPEPAEGELLVVIGSFSISSPTVTPPTGFEVALEDPAAGAMLAGVYGKKDCSGTEDTTVTFTTGSSCSVTWHVYKVGADQYQRTTNISDTIEVGTTSEGTGTGPDPGNLNIGGLTTYSQNVRLITCCAVDANETFSGYPTNYANGTTTSNTTTLATAQRATTTAQENADAFTKSGSAQYSAFTIAIHPGEWNNLYASASSGKRIAAFWRKSDGVDASSYSFRQSPATEMMSKVYRIAAGTWSGIPEAAAGVQQITQEPDPPSLSPSWGSAKTLWFVHAICAGGTLDGSEDTNLGNDLNASITGQTWNSTAYHHIADMVPQNTATVNPPIWSVFTTNPTSQVITFAIQGGTIDAKDYVAAFATEYADVWLDTSDLSTLWQDSARTTPVTASGQTVEAIDDKSGNNRHFINASGASTFQSAGFNGRRTLRMAGAANDLYETTASWAHGVPGTAVYALRNDATGDSTYASGQAYTGDGSGNERVLFAPDADTGTGPGFDDGAPDVFGTVEISAADVWSTYYDTRGWGGSGSQVALRRHNAGAHTEIGSVTFSSWSSTQTHFIGGHSPDHDMSEYIYADSVILEQLWAQDLSLAVATKWGVD